MDMYFFGLVNEIIFNHNEINNTRKNNLRCELESKIKELKREPLHQCNPAALKYLKQRIAFSLAIYKEYINEKSY